MIDSCHDFRHVIVASRDVYEAVLRRVRMECHMYNKDETLNLHFVHIMDFL